jgi:Spy/CpxP family protein refolding chaperone
MRMATTKARGEAVTLVAVVFLLGILLGGVANHLWGESVWGMRNDAPAAVPPNHLAVELTQELQLTPDQQKQLNAIIADTQEKWRALYAPLEGKRTEIREQSHDQMRTILTPEQRPKFDTFMRRLDEQRKRDAQKSPIPGPAR